MESRRRCWIGHEHQSSYSPKSCVSNLTSNEWCRCRHDAHQGDFFRAHTLLLIVQVFLLAIAGVPTSCNVCLGPSATNASSDTRPQSRSTFTPGMLDTPLQDLRMSVMSCTMDSIKALPQNYYTSGHGEAAATMPLTKEFVLAVQLFLVLGYECLDFVSAYRGPTCFSMLDLPCRGCAPCCRTDSKNPGNHAGSILRLLCPFTPRAWWWRSLVNSRPHNVNPSLGTLHTDNALRQNVRSLTATRVPLRHRCSVTTGPPEEGTKSITKCHVFTCFQVLHFGWC
ncbi:uncharacterized protein LOC119178211 isoform X6 [Rhipicephalus microplus]|uniref:uncharacterized protein LOC119178211 isoform X6 n=1 Tax=Rhipicephalus microplus TaxID=6941 RepID=UPI003F6A62F0